MNNTLYLDLLEKELSSVNELSAREKLLIKAVYGFLDPLSFGDAIQLGRTSQEWRQFLGILAMHVNR